VLLHHPSICQDQQVLLKLQQTSKVLQADIASHCISQLPVVCRARRHEQLLSFVCWASKPKNACLLKALDVQLSYTSRRDLRSTSAADAEPDDVLAAEALGALQVALCHSAHMQLQEFSLTGAPASTALLQHLPAARLTRLVTAVGPCGHRGVHALAALTALRSLDLRSSSFIAFARCASLTPLASHLQQLTQLAIGEVNTYTLFRLQGLPALKVLDAAVAVDRECDDHEHLPEWLEQHAGVLRSLQLRLRPWEGVLKGADMQAIGAAFAAAAAAAAAVNASSSTAAVTMPADEAAAAGGVLQLQHLSVSSHVAAGPMLAYLPTCSYLTELCCGLGISEVTALCALTALRKASLQLLKNDVACARPRASVAAQAAVEAAAAVSDAALAPLSALTQLTQLRLIGVRLPQLLQLPVCVRRLELQDLQKNRTQYLPGWAGEEEEAEEQQQHPAQLHVLQEKFGGHSDFPDLLQLGHLTRVTALLMLDAERPGHYTGSFCFHHSSRHRLPCSLRFVQWPDLDAVEPLLRLRGLEQLQLPNIWKHKQQQLSQLRSLPKVTELQISCCSPDAVAVRAWQMLPLRSLTIWELDDDDRLPYTYRGLTDAVVQHLSALQALTSLKLKGMLLLVSPKQLAAVLQRLTQLQQLSVTGTGRSFEADVERLELEDAAAAAVHQEFAAGMIRDAARAAAHGTAGFKALLQALCGLARCKCVYLFTRTSPTSSSLQKLKQCSSLVWMTT
jgi:hypothetical protein